MSNCVKIVNLSIYYQIMENMNNYLWTITKSVILYIFIVYIAIIQSGKKSNMIDYWTGEYLLDKKKSILWKIGIFILSIIIISLIMILIDILF